MKTVIQNSHLMVIADSLGGELQSIQDNEGTEYLWQRDVRYWDGIAPNLFPYIARLTKGTYLYRGKEYSMGIHGFVWNSQLELVEHHKESMLFRLTANKDTRKMYPFDFIFAIKYQLEENTLKITYKVENTGIDKMYFGIGGHPGFRVPMDEGCEFSDYTLEFGEKCFPRQIVFSEDCFVTEQRRDFLLDNNRIYLQHTMFDHDAIVLERMAKMVRLYSENGSRHVRIEYPQMQYLGIWHAPKTEAPYICIEPWSSLPSRRGVIEDLETQNNLIGLEKGQIYSNTWSITCGKK